VEWISASGLFLFATMETGAFQRGRRPDEEEEEKDVHRLRDMVVEEVSLVDRAANRQKFLVVKRRTDMGKNSDENLGPEVVQDENGRFTAVRDVEKARGKAKDEEEDEDEEKQKASGKENEDEEDEDGKPKGRKKADGNAAGNQLTIPAPVKAAVLRIGTEALERLMSVVNQVKDAAETDEKVPIPLPADMGKEIAAIAQLLTSVSERYPSPKAKSEHGELVEKAGRKMSGNRLNRFREALELLQKLVEELDGKRAPRGAEQGPRTTDPAFPNVGAGTQPDAGAAADPKQFFAEVPGLKDLMKSVQSLTEVVREQQSRLARMEKAEGLPNSRRSEGIRPAPEPQEISWPMDMNKPLTRESVAKELSFFDDA
jgi:hypothetical protein